VLTLVLTRHGLTDRSDPEQHLGQGLDIGLSEAGRAQAAELAARIGGQRFDRIVSSPLVRALETARSIAGDRPVAIDRRLAEMDYGTWEGLTYAEIEDRDPSYRARWVADPATVACPGGESGDEVADRARAFLDDELGAASGIAERVVLAVAHSSLDRILLCVALGIPIREYRDRFTQSQVNVTALTFPPDGRPDEARLLVMNDTAHVAPAGRPPWEPSPGA